VKEQATEELKTRWNRCRTK